MDKNAYIVCMGRSGSTLLRQMLDMHPNIIAPPESFFVLHLMDKYGKINNWTSQIKKNFISDLYTDRPFRLIWNIPIKLIQDALNNAPAHLSFIDVTNIVRTCYDPQKVNDSHNIFIDKNPIYSILFKKVVAADPSAKFIHLIRDPRGVINGQIQTFKRKDIFALGHLWTTRNTEIENTCKSLNIKYHQVRFEDLVAKPEETITSICNFLNIEYSDKLLQYNKRIQKFYSKHTKHFTNKHESTQKPLSKEISEKWKKSLSKEQLNKVAFTTYKLANKYGYPIESIDSNFKYSLMITISKTKLKIMTTLLHLYFNLPIQIRKVILFTRSKFSDHKYRT